MAKKNKDSKKEIDLEEKLREVRNILGDCYVLLSVKGKKGKVVIHKVATEQETIESESEVPEIELPHRGRLNYLG